MSDPVVYDFEVKFSIVGFEAHMIGQQEIMRLINEAVSQYCSQPMVAVSEMRCKSEPRGKQ